jgi:RNA recognition motif-containing protein
MNLFIGNLDYSIREQQLRELFEAYGEVTSAKVITDKLSGRSKGYGFVEMSNDAEGESAIAALNGQQVKNRNISVTQARPRAEGGNDRG